MADDPRMKITDVRVLAALAHPVRLAILHLLLTLGERTATQCADVVGASPSACSYHLRHLERFGLVARADPATADVDGRTRMWRAVSTGFDFGEPLAAESPALRVARQALLSTSLQENTRLARHYLDHVDDLPAAWQGVAAFSTYALVLTPDELRDVAEAIDAIVRPLRSAVRREVPEGALPVRVALDAFPRTDLA